MTVAKGTHSIAHDARWLALARAAWILLSLAGIMIFVVGTVALYSVSSQPCTMVPLADQSACFSLRQAAQQVGFSEQAVALYFTAGVILEIVPWLLVGALIFWRKSQDLLGILISLALVLFGTVVIDFPIVLWAASRMAMAVTPINVVVFVGTALAAVWYIFPDGRFVPSWTRWVSVLWLFRVFFSVFAGGSPLDSNSWPEPLPRAVAMVFALSLVYSLLYRYRHTSNLIQRQQIKWVVAGGALYACFYVLGYVLDKSDTPTGFLTRIIYGACFYFSSLLFAVCLGLSILRYRLLDIDILVRRTLVYVPLTAIIAGIIAASITITQKFFISMTGQESDAATVLTTLIVVAALDPMKSWLQKLVDTRFKEAPDPSKRLDAFARQLESDYGVIEPRRLARRFLNEAVTALDAKSGAICLGMGEAIQWALGEWKGDERLRIPLPADEHGQEIGYLALGTRKNGMDYSDRDTAALKRAARVVAGAIRGDGEASNVV